jgi:hypothetical protein
MGDRITSNQMKRHVRKAQWQIAMAGAFPMISHRCRRVRSASETGMQSLHSLTAKPLFTGDPGRVCPCAISATLGIHSLVGGGGVCPSRRCCLAPDSERRLCRGTGVLVVHLQRIHPERRGNPDQQLLHSRVHPVFRKQLRQEICVEDIAQPADR